MILSLFLLPLGGCFDSDINRSMYEADGEEMQRENHIVGATLKGMQGLVIPTREHLYQFMDAMAGGAYGGYLEGIVDTWVMKFSTFNPEQGWLKSPFADPIKDMYPQYRDMLNKTDDSVALAFGKILRVCIMHRVTDIYGPIPYSKMMDNDNSGEDLAVPYDSQEQVYTQMLKELEEADKVLEENKVDFIKTSTGFIAPDNIYSKVNDINHLYVISDLLVTDYSSVFFDYGNLKRPEIFYMYDLDAYGSEIRGFYIDLDELPGPIVKTEDELIKAIKNAESDRSFDEKYKAFNAKFNYLDDGKAAQRVTEAIIEE